MAGDFNPRRRCRCGRFWSGAVLLYRRHDSGGARAGRCVLLLQSGLSYLLLRAGGRAGWRCWRDAAGDQPVSLLLQPAGDSGADADRADAGGAESGGAAAATAPAGAGVGCDRPAVHADDADQDDGAFLLPALGWAMVLPLWQQRKLALRCAAGAGGRFACVTFGLWMALVVRLACSPTTSTSSFVNTYVKPTEFYWPLLSFWWSFHGGLWVDHILIPLAGAGGVVAAADCAGAALGPQAAGWTRSLAHRSWPSPDTSLHDLPEPSSAALLCRGGILQLLRGGAGERRRCWLTRPTAGQHRRRDARLGWAVVAVAALAAVSMALQTHELRRSPRVHLCRTPPSSSHTISMRTPTASGCWSRSAATRSRWSPTCPAVRRLRHRGPCGASWPFTSPAGMPPGTTSIPARSKTCTPTFRWSRWPAFRAFDDPERNVLVLFKLHPLPGGQVRDPGDQNLQSSRCPTTRSRFPIE